MEDSPIKRNHANDEIASLNKIVIQQKAEIFQLKHIIDNIPGDIYWKDKNGVWLGLNITASETLRKMGFLWNPNDVIGKTDYELFKKETADEFRKNDLEVMQQGNAMTKEEVNILLSGERITQLSTKRPLLDKQGNIIGIVGNTINISHLKKIENDLRAAQAANQAKTEFLNNMRHDIRTPLSGIIGAAEILQQTIQNPNQQQENQEWAQNIAESSHALLRFLNQILEIVNLDTGQSSFPDHQSIFNLKALIEDMLSLHQAKALEKHLALHFHYQETLPIYFVGNAISIQRIILELITNALKFTQQGTITVQAQSVKQEGNQALIKLSVTDTGIGIPSDKQKEIYSRFKRLTPAYQGTYPGLDV